MSDTHEGTTHWEGCEQDHHDCALAKLTAALERLERYKRISESGESLGGELEEREARLAAEARIRELEAKLEDAERNRPIHTDLGIQRPAKAIRAKVTK